MRSSWRPSAITAAVTGRNWRWLPALLFLWAAAPAWAGHSLELRIGSVEHPQARIKAIHLQLALPRTADRQPGRFSAEAVSLGKQDFGPVQLDCGHVELALPRLSCVDAHLALQHPELGDLALRGALHHAPGETRAELQGTINDSPARLQLRLHAGGASVQLQLESMAADRLAELLPGSGWALAGLVDASLSAELDPSGTLTGTLVLGLRELDLSSPDGRIATEALGLTAIVGLQGDAREQRGTLRLLSRGGLAYVDPVLLDLDSRPGNLLANLIHRDGRIWLEQLRWRQPGLLQAHGQASLSWTPQPALHRLNLRVDEAALPDAYATFLQPFLIGTVLDSLDTSGQLSGELDVRDGQALSASMQLRQVIVDDRRERFALRGLEGGIAWVAEGPAPPSRLQWQGGQLYRITLGAGLLDAFAQGSVLRLRRPLTLPVEDGALRLASLQMEGLGSADFAVTLEGRLEPISLQALSRALDWPELQGTVSGSIPHVTYSNRQLALDDALQARLFDGTVNVDRFRLDDPLGRFPQLQADIRLRGLDLELITGTFAFGRITGRLDGDILGLELLGWEPVAFDARFRTPPGDRSTRRISQRAIENISDLGAGGTALLSGTILRFFDEFRYRQLGIRCVLRDEVCRMSGIRPEGDGYVLVQGSGVPRVDVIGFTETVSWPTLLEQLRAVTQ